MTNHVHLLATPVETDGISRLLQGVGRRYVQFVNTSYRRSGTLWEGRHKASLIDAEHYLMAAIATSNSTLFGPGWRESLATIRGQAMRPIPRASKTILPSLTTSIWLLVATKMIGNAPTGSRSARSWRRPMSPAYATRSTYASRWATTSSSPRSSAA